MHITTGLERPSGEVGPFPAICQVLWQGPNGREARVAFGAARARGASAAGALVLANVASWRDCWLFRRRIASTIGCSVRTVQRWLTWAHEAGLIGRARGKPDEVPAGASGPVPCGWSHRWWVGRGLRGERLEAAISTSRVVTLVRRIWRGDWRRYQRHVPELVEEPRSKRALVRLVRASEPRVHWTAAEIDAELARLDLERQRGPD
jgi:hypothetical protein